ncbi:hypothetical protein [Knoellia subterranea]|uniref:Uncharacterized protein n=1 Tax=Knoellia subterranea KCTC 19937 TaxID=1385521 RepID=A0A0A0JQK6_9MICO|nr:hypothetical protein [Knoellia subterranea]KGN38322.1 hypothetical protein N803_09875 [Knoellia subterranea KCTC 19937]
MGDTFTPDATPDVTHDAGEVYTRVESPRASAGAGAGEGAPSAAAAPPATPQAPAGSPTGSPTDLTTDPTTRDWSALAAKAWPVVAMVLAAALWWPTAFSGRADWMHLPLAGDSSQGVAALGSTVFLGCLVGASVVAALVSSPWPRFGIAFGLTVAAWLLSDGSGDLLKGGRPVLAALAGLGMLLGLWVGARAPRGPVAVAAYLGMVAGLSPATWGRGVVLAIAVALPFWAATKDRVAPTIFAVVRVILTWLFAVLIAIGLHVGWSKLRPGLAGSGPVEAARVVARGFVDHLRAHWLDLAETALRAYTGWIWLAAVLAVVFVAARVAWTSRTRLTRKATAS